MFKTNTQLVDKKVITINKMWLLEILGKNCSLQNSVIPNKIFSKIENTFKGLGLKNYPHIHSTNSSNKVFI